MKNTDYSTEDLEKIIKEATNINKTLDIINESLIDIKPSTVLKELIVLNGLQNKDFLNLLDISPSYFYEILNGTKLPGRDVFIQFLIAANCNLEEAKYIMKICGYHILYGRNRRDAALIHSISRQLSLTETNILLDSLGLPLL